MTLTELHQKIGTIQRTAKGLARTLELTDRLADMCGNPHQAFAIECSGVLRGKLQGLFIRLHHLEARLPTPELLSARAYDRMIALGFQIEAAEAKRVTTYREAAQSQRHQHAA